jgi:protein-disulfide isomerase
MRLLILLAILGATAVVLAADKRPVVTDQQADAMIQKLEESGKLDAALDRAIQRYGARQQESQRKQQEEQISRQKQMNKNVRKPDAARDHIYGVPNAEVTMIEFSDYECPFCKQFNGVPQEVVKRMGGRVNYIWRHFPLSFHNPMAHREAEAAECVSKLGGNDAFWAYTDTVMARTATNGKGMPASNGDPIMALGKELKLDPAAFKKCLDSGEMKSRVDDDQKDGVNSGISGTPGTIIINNKTGKTEFVNGALPLQALESAVRSVLTP